MPDRHIYSILHLAFCQTLVMFILSSAQVKAQGGFYDLLEVQEVRLMFLESNWRSKLDSMMKSGNDSTRILADIEINGEHLKNAGVRFKGFSSWNEGEIKNPFNIDLDYLIKHKNYNGVKKIRLSNVIHDPSFIRETLSYHIARQYMPSSEANYARVYVNDTLIGLYTSVESVDDLFLEKHFGRSDLPLFKGSPQKLIFPFGQNANLAWISNTDSSVYTPYYQLSSDYGWERLMNFIDILNNHSDSLESVLNIDRALWMHAFNYALLNLDSYVGYAQNYYLAMDDHGRFNTIPWDLNMSFGSFRSSDGSLLFQGLTIEQLKTLDPLQHLNFSISPRPLMKKLFENTTYQRMYIAHLRTIMDEQVVTGAYLQKAQEIRQLINPFVLQDTNSFYTYTDFQNNLDTTVGGTPDMMYYVGIRELMEARIAYLSKYRGYSGEPSISEVKPSSSLPDQQALLWISAKVTDGDDVRLFFRQAGSALFTSIAMYDDGLHHDSLAADGVYGTSIVVQGDVVQYYLYAQNDSAGVFSPARAQLRFYTVYPKIRNKMLVINEINRSRLMNDHGSTVQCNHWIECYNNSKDTLSTHGLWLSNHIDHLPWCPLPDSLIPPGHFLILHADDVANVPGHCGFSLNTSDGWIGLGYDVNHFIDSVCLPVAEGNTTYGRYPNGYGDFMLMPATYAERNIRGNVKPFSLHVYPNPAKSALYVEWVASAGTSVIQLLSLDGKVCFEEQLNADHPNGIAISLAIPISGLKAGMYMLQILDNDLVLSEKVVIYD